jgi:CCR4-NOT complex subunit CAF16
MHLGRVKEWGAAQEMLADTAREGSRALAPTGNSDLGELVLDWLRADLEERGPRGRRLGESLGEGRTYESLEGKGGYGLEARVE